jgi:5-carboxymethyl-2-hydroxymuconic-semialdehyde dehydrogenase
MVNTARVAGVDVDSPIDEQPIAEIARGTSAEVSAAVHAAREAFGGWSSTSPELRSRALNAIADGIERRAEDLAQVETRDNGALLRSHRRGVMPRAAHNFRFFADWLGRLDAGDLEINGHREQVSWAPSGVTAVITPWNAPLMLATWRIAPALAAGNTVVAKPPEWAPLTASLLADITAEAGLPDGVFNVVQGTGAEAGAPLAAHPDLARVCFTGSVATGRLVAAAAGAQLTPVSLELGGKSPLLVFADADLDLAVRHAVGQYDNAGQVCLAGTRLLVDERIADDFTARFLDAAAALRQGDPRDDDTDMGPNITRAHLERVDGFVRRAVAAGARPLLGGTVNADLGGLYYRPTLLAGAKPGSEILTEEVFGPVLTLQTFSGEDEAVALANSTRYGLAATMFTGDHDRAERVSARLVAGTVWVNCFFVRDLRAPFGGAGLSGIGREGGTWSFDFYGDVKNTVYAPEGWRSDG